ncbi:hypothetical protein AAVH_34365, partial [Aphelenchoides avenae]
YLILQLSKRPNRSPEPASEDLVKRFKAAANDVVRLREIVESSDSVSVAAAIAALLAGDSSSAPSDPEQQRKVVLADDVLLDALQFLSRFYLDPLLVTCKLTRNLVIYHMRDVCLRDLEFATLRRHPRHGDECLWLRAEDKCHDWRRTLDLTVTNEEASEVFCNVLRFAYVDRFAVCEVSLTDHLLASLKPALKMVVDHWHYLHFHDVDFKSLSPATFLDTLLSLTALRDLGFYSIRNQTSPQQRPHTCDINTDHVTGDISGRGIIMFLIFDDVQRSLEVHHPRLTPPFVSELIEAIKSGRIARSDSPRKIVELRYASGTLDISTLSQYNSQTDPNPFPIWSKYFIDGNIKIEHHYCGQPYIQFFA